MNTTLEPTSASATHAPSGDFAHRVASGHCHHHGAHRLLMVGLRSARDAARRSRTVGTMQSFMMALRSNSA
jgi:hypothetical protein